MDYADVYVDRPNKVPVGEHWAILEGTSVWVPGDERSRQAPGHGYPEHTDYYLSYAAYLDEQKFKAELSRRLARRDNVVGIHVAGVYSASD